MNTYVTLPRAGDDYYSFLSDCHNKNKLSQEKQMDNDKTLRFVTHLLANDSAMLADVESDLEGKYLPHYLEEARKASEVEEPYVIKVVADWNDGDYATEISKISLSKVKELTPLIKALKANGDWENPSRYVNSEVGSGTGITDRSIELFDQYVPYVDNCEIHTIESIEVYKKPQLLKF